MMQEIAIKTKEKNNLKSSNEKKDILLEGDGGVNTKNFSTLVKSGADILVAGSSIFKGGSSMYKKNIYNLRNS